MRVYTDTLGYTDILHAMADTRPECDGVYMDLSEVTLNGRRRRMTFDVQLEGNSARHTRKRNTGQHGAGDEFAATWMDWGWLIAVLFRYEPTAVIGQYDGREEFLDRTRSEVTRKLHGHGADASVRNFARRYAAWWPSPHPDNFDFEWCEPQDVTSPFVLVDRVCPPNNLIALHPPELLEAWLIA